MENISPKEWIISIIVVLLTLALAIFINPFVKDSMLEDIRTYQNALQIDNEPTTFQYAQQTRVGDVFAYGVMRAVTPMSIPELVNSYSIIEKITERYTRHTRYVCDSHDKNGNCTGGHYETYYTWDTDGQDTYISNYFDFMSVQFQNAQLNLSTEYTVDLSESTVNPQYLKYVEGDYLYDDKPNWLGIHGDGDLRHYYQFLPTEFHASMFVKFNGNLPKATVYYEQSRSKVLENKETDIKNFDFVYYLVWVLGIGGAYFWWAYSYGDVE